jgi:hypothetical protein
MASGDLLTYWRVLPVYFFVRAGGAAVRILVLDQFMIPAARNGPRGTAVGDARAARSDCLARAAIRPRGSQPARNHSVGHMRREGSRCGRALVRTRRGWRVRALAERIRPT